MATLVLSGVGGAAAGSLGAAIGRVTGREIDNSLRGRNRAGRLSDLRVQTSHYGATIPAIYGRMRVAGTVIWATDLIENALVSKTGSRRAYSVSFAVALSSRELVAAGRIWADGRLIRGVGGDHKTRFKVRFHPGTQDQSADPLIVSIEGADQAPTFRGTALLVFEDFDLSTFGNRLPQITVEVDGEGPLSMPGMFAELGLTRPVIGTSVAAGGYALDGDDVMEAVSPLLSAFAPRFSLRSGQWEMEPSSAFVEVEEREVLSLRTYSKGDEQSFSRVSIRYFDASLDYASGEKSAHLPTTDRRDVLRIELPAVVDSDVAKGLAQARLAEQHSSVGMTRISLPLSWSSINLGDRIRLPGRGDADLEVRSKSILPEQIELVLGKVSSPARSTRSEPGRSNVRRDVMPAPVSLFMVELPQIDSNGRALIGVGAISDKASSADLSIKLETAGIVQELVPSGLSALRGRLMAPLSSGPAGAFDMAQQVVVEMENDGWLTSCGDQALFGGANLLRIGDEFLQFAVAEPIYQNKFRLSKLLRGCFGSVIPSAHPTGSLAYFLESGTFSAIALTSERIGSQIEATCIDLMDRRVSTKLTFTGQALRPRRPAHLQWQRDERGLTFKWTRCSRLGAAWLDDVEVPLGENLERYRLELASEEAKSRVYESFVPELLVTQDDLIELGTGPFSVTVQQLGDFGISLPTTIFIA